MILADSGVLIDYFRSADPKSRHLLSTMPVAVAGILRAEVLAGARTASHRASPQAMLDGLIQIPTPEEIWDLVGDHLQALRRAGRRYLSKMRSWTPSPQHAGLELGTRASPGFSKPCPR